MAEREQRGRSLEESDQRELVALEAREERLRTLLAPILTDAMMLQAQIGRVSARQQAIRSRAQREQEAARQQAAIDTRAAAKLKASEEFRRARELEVADIRQRAEQGLSSLDSSHSQFSRFMGVAIDAIFNDPEKSFYVPDVMEQSLASVGMRSNGDRFKLSFGEESIRLLFFRDGTYGAVYNPKPDTVELDTARQIAGSLKPEAGFKVNPRIYGVHVSPFGDPQIQPFFVTERRGPTKNDGFETGIVNVEPSESYGLLRALSRVLTRGDSELPKNFAKRAASKSS